VHILITGGAGYIGSHLADAFIEADHHITVVDNQSTSQIGNIGHLPDHPRFRFVCDNILNPPLVARFINQALDGQPIKIFDDEHQTRCFTHIDDTVRGTLLAGILIQSEGKAFDIGSNPETVVLELARMLR
jgi:nucleoside-diphosphate-sugar epimerase